MSMAEEGIGLDDSSQQKPENGAPEVNQPKDADGIPFCRKHHCRMKQASGGRKNSRAVYYACPVPKCGERAKHIKVQREGLVPNQPQKCPRCESVFCERSDQASTGYYVILQCPNCGWKTSPMPIPQLVDQDLTRRAAQMIPPPGIGDR